MEENTVAISPRLLRRTLNMSIFSAALWSVFFAMTGGAQLTGALLSIRMSEAQIGWVMSLGLVFLPLQIVGAMLQQRYFRRKLFWGVCCGGYYGTFFVLALLLAAWLRLPHAIAVSLFMATFALGQILVQVQGAVGLAWLSDLVPVRESNSYWSRRNALCTLAGLVAGLAAGKATDLLGRDDISTYVVMFGVGGAFGMLSFLVYLGAVDNHPEPTGGAPLRLLLRETWNNRNFRFLTAFFSYQSWWAWLSSGFLFVHMQKTMNFSMLTIQLLTALGAFVGFISAGFFRIVGARYGRTPVLVLCSVIKAGEFVLWALMLPQNGWLDRVGGAALNRGLAAMGWPPIDFPPGLIGSLPVFVVGGFVNIGLVSAQQSLLTSLCGQRIKGFAFGVFYGVIGLAGFITSSQSGVLYEYLDSLGWFRFPFTPFNLLAGLSAVGYLSSVLWLTRFREDGAAPAVSVVRDLFSSNPLRSIYHAHVLGQPMSEIGRAETLRSASGRLIASELVRDLYSPSSRVRDGVLLSVTRQDGALSGDVIEELVKLLDAPEMGLQTMAARTLGRIREKSATPRLIACFDNPDLSVAQAAIFASGLIAAPEFVPELVRVIADPERPLLHSGAAEALSKIGGAEHLRMVFFVYQRQTNWVLRRQGLIAATRLVVADPGNVYGWFESETRVPGSQMEKRLKNVVTHPSWEGKMCPPPLADMLAELDGGRYAKCAALILAPLLERCRVFPERHEFVPWGQLSECFMPGGRMRYSALNSTDFEGVALWFQLKLWAELNYEVENPDPMVFFALLLGAESVLDSLRPGEILRRELSENFSEKSPPGC